MSYAECLVITNGKVSVLCYCHERLNVRYLIMLRKVTFYRIFIVPTLLFVICFYRFYAVITMKKICLKLFVVVGSLL